MGGYDERELAYESRPLTTFETPLGRFQLTRLPQGATNSVAVYQAQMMWILQDEIPHNVGIFIDDGGIKGPVSDYNQETQESDALSGNMQSLWNESYFELRKQDSLYLERSLLVVFRLWIW